MRYIWQQGYCCRTHVAYPRSVTSAGAGLVLSLYLSVLIIPQRGGTSRNLAVRAVQTHARGMEKCTFEGETGGVSPKKLGARSSIFRGTVHESDVLRSTPHDLNSLWTSTRSILRIHPITSRAPAIEILYMSCAPNLFILSLIHPLAL